MCYVLNCNTLKEKLEFYRAEINLQQSYFFSSSSIYSWNDETCLGHQCAPVRQSRINEMHKRVLSDVYWMQLALNKGIQSIQRCQYWWFRAWSGQTERFAEARIYGKRMTFALFFLAKRLSFSYLRIYKIEKDLHAIWTFYTLWYFLVFWYSIGKYVSDFAWRSFLLFLLSTFSLYCSFHLFFSLYIYFVIEIGTEKIDRSHHLMWSIAYCNIHLVINIQ